MRRFLVFVCAALLICFGAIAAEHASAVSTSPATGYTIHVDALDHFTAHPNEVAHHYCKQLANMLECQIYDSDAPNARLVAVETIISDAQYAALPAAEKPLWHNHAVELPKVHAVMPGMPAAQQKKLVAQILKTYGKVYVIWDPMTNAMPIGKPFITIP